MTLTRVKNRQEALDTLQGYAIEGKRDLDQTRMRNPLIKSYMLETVSQNGKQISLPRIFDQAGQTLKQIDDTLYTIYDRQTQQTRGLVEQLLPRYPVIFTHEDTKIADPWTKRIVESTAQLDHLWISGKSFERMLDGVIKTNPGYRYGRIVFQHTKLFEHEGAHPVDEDSDNEGSDNSTQDSDNDDYFDYHKGSRFSFSDTLDVIKDILPKLQEVYAPFYAFSQLRFPSAVSGGHDLYFDGKITNRSDSFSDHRTHVEYVLSFYRRSTDIIEKTTWEGVERTKLAKNQDGEYLVGAPVVFEFSQPLADAVFENFIKSTFSRKYNRFRLWGDPTYVSRNKVHVYALDRHLWQPLFLEITPKKMIAMIPHGTCGNTVHRLVTNIQQYLNPDVSVWVGNYKYSELLKMDDPG